MNSINIIDLEKFRSKNGRSVSKVFTGRDRGADVRNRSQIDSLFEKSTILKIVIPTDIFSITPSFLEELFLHIAQKYSKDEIFAKLDFSGNEYALEDALCEAIDRIKQTHNALQYARD